MTTAISPTCLPKHRDITRPAGAVPTAEIAVKPVFVDDEVGPFTHLFVRLG